MAPRPNWKGYLKLSLVSCPVALFPATTTSERVTFRTLNRESGNRVRRQFVDEQSGEPVETPDQVKGYQIAKGEYIQIEDDEIKAVQLESNHTIEIERFVPKADIDDLYVDTPYFLTPTDRVGEEAFAVIRDALRSEKMVGLARVVLFRRERILCSSRATRASWRPACTTPTRSMQRRTIPTRYPISTFQSRCSISPSTSSSR